MLCPHCHRQLPQPPGALATQCPACRLLIGPGRALSASAPVRPNAVGAASGSLANAALREHAVAGDARVILAALRRVADLTGVSVLRLRLFDYDIARRGDETLPSIATVLATFGTWKAARARAGGKATA